MAPVLTGAILGWWFFGWRGTLLFSGLALAAMLALGLFARRRPGLGSGLGLLAAAALFQASSTHSSRCRGSQRVWVGRWG